MATSIQRLIIMVLLIDMLLLGVGYFKGSVDDGTLQDQMNTKISSYLNVTTDFNEQFPNPTPETENLYLDKQFGDLKFGAGTIFKIMSQGLPTEGVGMCQGEDCSISYMYYAGLGLSLVIIFIHLLLMMEALFLWHSKKYS